MANPSDDPLYAAWMQAMGFENANAQQMDTNAIARAQATTGVQREQLNNTNQRDIQDINGKMESRGMLNSGETGTRLAQQQQDYDLSNKKLDTDLANQTGSINDALTSHLASMNAQDVQRQAEAIKRMDDLAKQQAAQQAAQQIVSVPDYFGGLLP